MHAHWTEHPKVAFLNPYLRLMRLDHPTGIFLLLWPCWWAIGFAMNDIVPWELFILFAVGSVFMRSAGCIVNDMIDRKLDANVERTVTRPLASGEIKIWQALAVLAVLLFISFCLLMFLNRTTIILGYIILVPIAIYPLMKRITYWPQLFLAFTFNWSILMGWAAVRDEVTLQAIILYFAGFLWTVGYDTIYSHQDKEDDAALGLKSTALRFGHNTKRFLAVLYAGTIILLWLSGIISKMGLFFHVFLMLGAFQLFWQVMTLELDSPESCMKKFRSNRLFGLLIFIAIISGKLAGF